MTWSSDSPQNFNFLVIRSVQYLRHNADIAKMVKLFWENDLLTALARYCNDGAALYEPFEEPLEKKNKLPSAKRMQPVVFQKIRERIENSKAGWSKGKTKNEDPAQQAFWNQVIELQNEVSNACPNFPLEPDQELPSDLMSLQEIYCNSDQLVITLIVYSVIDYEIEKLFSSLRNRLDIVLGRGEKASQSIHNVKAWLTHLSNMEQLGVFGNLVKPQAPYWLSAKTSFLESIEFHRNQIRQFKKADWPHRQLHKAYAAEKRTKDKPYRTWAIAALVALVQRTGANEAETIENITSIYLSLGLHINIRNFLTRQNKDNWILPDPSNLWRQLSANVLVTNLTPDIGKKSKITVAENFLNGNFDVPRSPK